MLPSIIALSVDCFNGYFSYANIRFTLTTEQSHFAVDRLLIKCRNVTVSAAGSDH